MLLCLDQTILSDEIELHLLDHLLLAMESLQLLEHRFLALADSGLATLLDQDGEQHC